MATTAGALSQVSVGPTTANLSSAVATAGTGPYTYQWYKSTTSGFTPGGGNIIAGATALTLADTGLIPNTQYYYKVVATDSGAVAGTSAQLAVATSAPTLGINQFAPSTFLGVLDMRFNTESISVQIDTSQATPLSGGGAVKVVNSLGGIPKVIGCAANSDDVFGFINYDVKSVSFPALSLAEISQAGNVMYLYATGVIARGARVQLDLSTNGGVAALVGSSGADYVGYALDASAAGGTLIRVKLKNPSYTKA